MDNHGRKVQLVWFEGCRRTIYCPYVDTVCKLEKALPGAAVFMKSAQRGKARLRQVVQWRTSPPLCFMDLSARFALLACASLAERNEDTCIKPSARTTIKPVFWRGKRKFAAVNGAGKILPANKKEPDLTFMRSSSMVTYKVFSRNFPVYSCDDLWHNPPPKGE